MSQDAGEDAGKDSQLGTDAQPGMDSQRSDAMLVLTRKTDERILIAGGAEAGGATITVVRILGNKVRIGVEAGKDVPIHRHEVQDEIDRNKP